MAWKTLNLNKWEEEPLNLKNLEGKVIEFKKKLQEKPLK